MTRDELTAACRGIRFLLFDCDGVLTDGRIILGADGLEVKCFSTKDGLGLSLWKQAGFLCGCISGRRSGALERRAQELSFAELHQQVHDKRSVLQEICTRQKLIASEVAYIGDDLNDLPLLRHVGLFLAPADAHPSVLARAHHPLSAAGGRGAVREAVDLILTAKSLLEGLVDRYLD